MLKKRKNTKINRCRHFLSNEEVTNAEIVKTESKMYKNRNTKKNKTKF